MVEVANGTERELPPGEMIRVGDATDLQRHTCCRAIHTAAHTRYNPDSSCRTVTLSKRQDP